MRTRGRVCSCYHKNACALSCRVRALHTRTCAATPHQHSHDHSMSSKTDAPVYSFTKEVPEEGEGGPGSDSFGMLGMVLTVATMFTRVRLGSAILHTRPVRLIVRCIEWASLASGGGWFAYFDDLGL